MNNSPDPQILNRLNKLPPFIDEEGKVVDKVEQNAEPQIGKVEGEEDKMEEPKERTKVQFEKVTTHNKELKEENETLKKELEEKEKEKERIREDARRLMSEGIVGSVNPEPMLVHTPPTNQQFPNLTQRQVNDVFQNLVDDQGYVNTDLLKDELRKANEQTAYAMAEARKAREEAQAQKKSFDDFQRTATAKHVHEQYPELNPENIEGFNPEYYEVVKNEMLNQWVKTGKDDFEAAAKKYYNTYVNKKQKIEKKQQDDALAQINATGNKSASTVRESFGEHEALVSAVRKGQKGALAERLKRSGF